MSIEYTFDILAKLKEAGYSTYKLRKDKILGEATIQKLRKGELVSWENISTICELLDCQPGDIIKYVPDWVHDRILELTEAREEKLGEYFNDKWSEDDSAEEKLGLYYSEEYIPEMIEKLEDDEDIDPNYIEALREVCFHFPQSEDKIRGREGSCDGVR